MNRKINYEAEFCGKVPLHQTNLIQPHGVLLIIDKKDFRILQASENAETIFNVDAKELVTQSLLRFISKEQGEKLHERFAKQVEGKLPFNLQFPGGQHLALVQAAEQYLVMGAKCNALLNGKYSPDIEDVQAIAKPVLRHRIVRNFKAEAEGISVDDVIVKLMG